MEYDVHTVLSYSTVLVCASHSSLFSIASSEYCNSRMVFSLIIVLILVPVIIIS